MSVGKLVQLGSVPRRAPLSGRALQTPTGLVHRNTTYAATRSTLSIFSSAATSLPSGSFHRRHATTKAQTKGSNSTSRSKPAASSSAAASASVPRHHQAKVEVIPFRIASESAREYLTVLAKTEVMPRVMSSWDIIKHYWRSILPWRSEEEKNVVKLERMSALYLPIWLIDASFEVKCRGNDGRAEANFISVHARFPGHTWKPMDALPLTPPPPYDMHAKQSNQKDPSFSAQPPKEAWQNLTQVDFEPYESYLKTKGSSKVDIKGGLPEPLPFTISPLFLPDMVRKQLASADATLKAELAAGFELPSQDEQGVKLAMSLVDKDGKPITTPPVSFEPNTLKVDMMAAYPILMPLHMAEFSYVEAEDGETRYLTLVMGGWDTSGTLFCLKEKGEDWKGTNAGSDPLTISQLDLYPRPPIKSQLDEWYERERDNAKSLQKRKFLEESNLKESDLESRPKMTRREIEALYARAQALSTEDMNKDLESRLAEKVKTEVAIKAEVTKRSAELLARADWIHWEREEREAFQVRTARADPAETMITKAQKERYAAAIASARQHPVDPKPYQWLSGEDERKAELHHPDRAAGLGRYIHWSSPHVQRLSHNISANRRYLFGAIPEVLLSRKRMASLEEAGHNVDTSLVKVELENGKKVTGDAAWETIVARDMAVRQQRESLKPRWLKALQDVVARR